MAEPIAEMPNMGAYGLDPATWTALPWSWARERLEGARNYWLTTVSGAGRPHSMPVWGVWDDDRQRFAFSCATEARKARNLAENPAVVVAPEDSVEVVSVEGLARPVVSDDGWDAWIERYLTKYRPMAPDLDAAFLRAGALFEVTPERALGVIEREAEFATRTTRWRFR